MPIRKRAYFILLIAIVPLLSLQAFIYYGRFKNREQEEMQANLELARAVAKNFNTFLQGVIREELAIGVALTGYQPLPGQDRDRMLDALQEDSPAVRSFFWMNSDGTVVAASVRAYIGLNFRDRLYFQKLKEGRDWEVSGLIAGRATGKPGFTVARGIRNENGELLGIVAAFIEPDSLETVVSVIRSAGAGVSLIDNKGIHVYRYPPTTYRIRPRYIFSSGSSFTIHASSFLKLIPG